MAGGLDVGDAGFAAHFFDGEIVELGDFVYDLFTGNWAEFARFIDADGAVFDEFEWCDAADFGHEEDGGKFAFEIADVGINVFSDILDGFWLDIGAHKLGLGS